MGMCADSSSACRDCRRYYDARRDEADAKDPESSYLAAVKIGKTLGFNRAERRRMELTRSRARKRRVS